MIFMHNLEIINSRSIIKSTLHCIELAFEKKYFLNQYVYGRTSNVLII